MRNLPLLAAAALCACTYQAENPQIFVQVDGIPQAASRLDVTLSDATGLVTPYKPTLQPGTVSILLSLAAPMSPGTFTVAVGAFDRTDTNLATGSAAGALPAAGMLQITLATAGLRGQYGTACDPGNAPCAAPNQ